MPKIVFRTGKRIINGKAELYARFYYGAHANVRSATNIYVPLDMWSAKDQRLLIKSRTHTRETTEAIETNKKIDELRQFIEEAYTQNPYIKSADWLRLTIDAFFHPTEETYTPVTDICQEYTKRHRLAEGTAKQYAVLVTHIKNFEETNGQLFIETISVTDMEDLDLWMRERMGHNTVVTKMKKLKSAVLWAYKMGKTDQNPFARYTIDSESYGEPISLTREERDAVYNYEGLSDALAIQRDIFVFQCHVGCRISDLMTLTAANVTKDSCLQYIPAKTAKKKHDPVIVPLSETANEIIKRYEGGETLLPFVSMKEYNEDIKTILKKVGINRIVIRQDPKTLRPVEAPLWQIASSHMARKTFADILFEVTESDTVVASMTGHSHNSAALKHYRKVKISTQRDAISKM